jgi:hypothetical protein
VTTKDDAERPWSIYALPHPAPEGWTGTRLGGSYKSEAAATETLVLFQGIEGLEVFLAYRGKRVD